MFVIGVAGLLNGMQSGHDGLLLLVCMLLFPSAGVCEAASPCQPVELLRVGIPGSSGRLGLCMSAGEQTVCYSVAVFVRRDAMLLK